MDKLQANTTHIATALCIDGKKLWRWYRDALSGFLEASSQEALHRYDFQITSAGKTKTVRVPILKIENIGPNMAIDEKQIGEEMHTVLTNRDTGKIALLASTLKSRELATLISCFDGKGFEVKTVTRDLSNSYDWFCRQAFPNAAHIADKFHIVKSLLDAQQDVRVRYRQEILREKRLKYEAFKEKEKLRKQVCLQNSEAYKRRFFRFKEEKLSNQETPLEVLARSRFLLYKYEKNWTPNQAERGRVVFQRYPQIKEAYILACSFRLWYRKENIGKPINEINQSLRKWYQKVEAADIDEMSNFKSLVERHQTIICRYFENGYTNAIAENMNSRIQRFVMINQGTRDRDFFYFRTANYFS